MTYQSEPTTMWFDRRLVLRKSPIHGIGTFATGDIALGELLTLVTGGVVYTAETLLDEIVDLMETPDDPRYITLFRVLAERINIGRRV